jgi:hypothetical protein
MGGLSESPHKGKYAPSLARGAAPSVVQSLRTEDNECPSEEDLNGYETQRDYFNLPPHETGSFMRRGLPISSSKEFTLPSRRAYYSDDPHKCSINQNSKIPPFDFTIERAELIQSYITSQKGNDMRFSIVPDHITNIFGNEVKRFMCALEAYRQSYDEPVLSIEFLISGISDLNFATYLKQVKLKSFIKSSVLEMMELPDWWTNTEHYLVSDIGEIFNYNYWFRWKESDPEDYKVAWEYPLKDMTKADELEFKETVRSFLPGTINRVEEEEILLSTSKSSCLEETGLQSRSRVYLKKEDQNTFSDEPLSGVRTLVYVSPANTRDTIILSVPQSNSVKLIEKQCALVCEEITGSAYYHNRDRLKQKVKRFREKYNFFLDRDFLKEGITKPRRLVQLIGEVFKEKYPDLPCNKYWGIYDNFYLNVNDEILEVPRGHGLGMANAITTIMQIAVFQMVLNEMERHDYILGDIEPMAFNDDLTIGFENLYDLETYWDVEDSVVSRLGLIRKSTKSHRGRNFVFCEIYDVVLNLKKSYYTTEMYQLFSLPTIAAAKQLSSSLSPWIGPTDIERYIQELVSFWGYEFYEKEANYPHIFGGWISPTYLGIRLDFVIADNLGINYEQMQALKASSVPLYKVQEGGRKYNSPFEQIFGEDLVVADEFIPFVPINKSINYMNSVNRKNISRTNIENIYTSWQYRRTKTFETKVPFSLNKRDIYEIIINTHPFYDFLATEDICVKKKNVVSSLRLERQARLPNPTLSLIKFFNRDKITDKTIPYWKAAVNCISERKTLTVHEQEKLSSVGMLGGSDPYPSDFYYRDIITPTEFFIYDKSQWMTASYHLFGVLDFLDPMANRTWEIKETEEDIMIDEILRSEKADIFLKLSNILGYKLSLEVVNNYLEEFELIIDPYIRSILEQDVNDDLSESSEEEPERTFGSYFDWQDCHNEVTRETFVYTQYYREIYSQISLQDAGDVLNTFGGTYAPDAKDLSSVAKLLWTSQGGELFTRPDGRTILWHSSWDVEPEEDNDTPVLFFGEDEESDY